MTKVTKYEQTTKTGRKRIVTRIEGEVEGKYIPAGEKRNVTHKPKKKRTPRGR